MRLKLVQLQMLPDLSSLVKSRIWSIDLSYNKLISIPDLSQIETLREIDLQENDLDQFPWELMEKKNLKMLIFRNNPVIIDENDEKMLKEWENNLNSSVPVIVY